MIDKSNKYYSIIKQAISPLCTNISQILSKTPSKFPYVYYSVLDNTAIYDLSLNERVVDFSIEIYCYTIGSTRLTDGKKIMSLIDDELRLEGFLRTMGVKQIENAVDTDVCQLVAIYKQKLT